MIEDSGIMNESEFQSIHSTLALIFMTSIAKSSNSMLVIVIDQLPRFVCSIEAQIPRAKPEG